MNFLHTKFKVILYLVVLYLKRSNVLTLNFKLSLVSKQITELYFKKSFFLQFQDNNVNIFLIKCSLLNNKKNKTIWSKDLVHEEPFGY